MSKLTPEQLKIAHDDYTKSKRVRAFLESEFWKLDLGPEWKDRQVELGLGALWSPVNKNEIGAVALGCAFNGGRSAEIEQTMSDFKVWLEKGERAKKLLEAENGQGE